MLSGLGLLRALSPTSESSIKFGESGTFAIQYKKKLSPHVETVVLLSDKKVDSHVSIDLDVEKIEGKSGTATYAEIKAYVEEKFGFKVTSLYIGQIKNKVGLEKRKNYNLDSGEGRVPTCPPEKEEAIMDAFKHFNLI